MAILLLNRCLSSSLSFYISPLPPSRDARGEHLLSYFCLLFSPLFLEKSSAFFERGNGGGHPFSYSAIRFHPLLSCSETGGGHPLPSLREARGGSSFLFIGPSLLSSLSRESLSLLRERRGCPFCFLLERQKVAILTLLLERQGGGHPLLRF